MTDKGGRWQTCIVCGSDMWLPEALNTAALAARGVIRFYCAYGHVQFYIVGESEADKLRRERDRLAQQIAQRDDEIRLERGFRADAERAASAARAQVAKLKKRASAGVCPCCNRSFLALKRHIAQKHPGFSASPANVVPLRAKAT